MVKNENITEKGQRWEKLLLELAETLKRNDRRINIIQEMDRLIQRTTDDSGSVFNFMLAKGLEEINADYGHISIKIDNDLEIKYSNSKDVIGKKIPIFNALCGSVFKKGEILSIDDVSKRGEKKYYSLHNETKSELALPIQDSQGVKIFGILNIEWKRKNEVSEDNLNFCKLLTGQIAIAMEKIKLWHGVRLISELSSELLVNIKNPEKVYGFILERILKILDFNLGQILLVNGEELLIVASSNNQDINVVVSKNSVCGHYIFNQKGKVPLNIKDISESEYKDKYQWFLGKNERNEMQMRSELVFPLIGNDNNTIGVINIEDPIVNAFTDFDMYIIGIFANMIASAMDASNKSKKIQDMENDRENDLIFATQGHLSIAFLHNFGGKVGGAKADLSEFKQKISHLYNYLPQFSGTSGQDFLEGILQDLRDAGELIKDFTKEMDPNNINNKRKQINLIDAVQKATNKAEKKGLSNVSFEFIKDNSVEKRKSIDALLTDQFDEVLDCLLNNAIEAMPNGGKIKIKVSLIELFTAGICITDTGIGMNEETINKIFHFGFTTKKISTRKMGQGIGLWFVRFYMSRFRGIVDVHSKPGLGTTFLIKIPIIINDNSN